AQEPCEIVTSSIMSTSPAICYRNGTAILSEYGVQQHNLNFNLLMLVTLILGYHIISFIILFIRIRRILK
ncbi:unnamed protein product, partial [Adineta steineri]